MTSFAVFVLLPVKCEESVVRPVARHSVTADKKAKLQLVDAYKPQFSEGGGGSDRSTFSLGLYGHYRRGNILPWKQKWGLFGLRSK